MATVSARTIETAKPEDKPYSIAIGEGLGLLVKPNGSKWWRFRYRHLGTAKMLSLGVTQTEVQAAIGKLGLEGVVAVHATVKPAAVSLDKALALITRGQGEQVAAHLPQLLQEIIPLLQLATPEQRWNLLKQIG